MKKDLTVTDQVDVDARKRGEGRVAIVTGGAGGIGRAIVERLALDGLSVALWDIDGSAALAIANEIPNSMAVAVDVTDEMSVAGAIALVLEKFGRIDVLVNGAGLVGPTVAVQDCDVDAWQKTIDVNLRSVFLCSRAVVAPMLETGFGRIVNISSIAGKEGNPFMSAYSSAKGAVIAFTKSMGKELAKGPILVNCIAPAIIETDFSMKMAKDVLDNSLAKIPLGRTGKPHEVASLVSWLSSDECSFSTGATFDLSGGRATY
ncbi:SDR family NAD(P)-dependent oxidoreductase [Caballeronia sp. 15715]|uniref:SDR family NAD(P)-dependent oxidoreductase n=1 Tax=Caballeronia sp. 15715 TaxID=3391030 RepID=UPI0039E335AA